MYDENRYPTLKFMKCERCGLVFTCSLGGCTDCPQCDSSDTIPYHPSEDENGTDRPT